MSRLTSHASNLARPTAGPNASPERQQLIENCQGLVKSIAWKIHQKVGRRVALEDLISEGQVGLLEAAAGYDKSRGNQFTTYAYYRIRGSILDSLNRQSWFSRAAYHGSRYEQMADDALASDSERGEEHPADWMGRTSGALAISYMIALDADQQLGQTLAGTEVDPVEDAICTELRGRLRSAIDRLPADAATLIRAAYFEGLSLKDAGERLGISKSWASRLHQQALEQLSHLLDPDPGPMPRDTPA